MKRVLVFLLFCIVLASCSNEREQEVIQKNIHGFYKSLNNRDFESLKGYMSPQIQQKIAYFKSLNNDLVIYKSYKVKNVVVNGNTAVVDVECVDEFGNKFVCNWTLVKINGEWKISEYGIV